VEAAVDVGGHGARRRDAGVAPAGEVDGRRLVEQVGQSRARPVAWLAASSTVPRK
jgi:hypothetical protein